MRREHVGIPTTKEATVREIDNLEAGLGAGLTVTAYGLMNAASAIGDAVGAAVRQRAYLKRVDELTRIAVRQNLADARKRAASKTMAADLLRQTAIHAYNMSLKEAA